MFKVRVIQNGVPVEDITVERGEVVIGRSPGCDVVVPQPYVSKRHVKILRGVVVVDLGSRNGTFVEDRRVKDATVLRTSRINLGDEDTVIEIEQIGDEPETVTRDGVDHETVELQARTASLQKQLEDAHAQVENLRRTTSVGEEVSLEETTRLDRTRLDLEQRVYSQKLEIERLQAEVLELRADDVEGG